MTKTALLFPGQGIQTIGMGKDFYDSCEIAKKIFDDACDIMGKDIKEIIQKLWKEKTYSLA